jgi:DNA-binding Xre family transcriptional regulator
MIEFQLKEMMKAKGVKSPYAQLRKAGMSYSMVQGYMTGQRHSIYRDHIEIFCNLLRCTPNELFAWSPSQPADDYADNPLQKIRKKTLLSLDERLRNMSVEEIEKRLGD